MRIVGIDFPEPLVAALREGRLVIFAGAGVSMGEPARLPNFDDLAKQIAHGTGKAKSDGETADRFLGRLKESGVKVHELAAEILTRDDPSPNSLHRDLLRCFPSKHAVRVVTTNFDRLFEEANRELPAPQISGFSAPALPIGSDFAGLVHVHGSLCQTETMVLTDEDFGRAYLTEGWARRFLLDLFRSFTVLFVGYSHSDVVMSYLGRALPPPDASRSDAPRRFALTDEPNHPRWQLLKITPIRYPTADPSDHSGLNVGVDELASYVQRDLLGWQRKIGDIAQGYPPFDLEEQDLISEALRHPDRVRFFTDVATHPKWMEWLHRRGHLEGAFDPTLKGSDDSVSESLAGWLCQRFARERAEDMLSVFGWDRMRVGSRLWYALSLELGAKSEGTREGPVWDPDVMAKWIALLLDSIPRELEYLDIRLRGLAEAAARAGLEDALIAVFDAMAGLSAGDRHAYADRAWALDQVWTTDLAPRVPAVAERLLVVVRAQLTRRHQRSRIWENATRQSGSATLRRTKIEAREDDSDRYDSNDVLIDAARDCLTHLVEHEPLVAAGHLDQMIRADPPLLRRIAINCAALRNDLSADQQTEWLLQHLSLYDGACQRELRLFADATYRDLSEAQKQRVLAAIDDYPDPTDDLGC